MFDIIKLLFDICLFKKGPQDLPYSVWLLRILLAVYVSIRVLMLSIHFDWLDVLLCRFLFKLSPRSPDFSGSCYI